MAVRSIPKEELPSIEFPECAAIFYFKKGSALHEPDATLTTLDHRHITEWMATNTRIKFEFKNGFDFAIDYFWEDEAVEAKLQGHLEPGETHEVNTILGHLFFAAKIPSDEPNAVVDYMVIPGEGVYTFHPSNHLERCEIHYNDEISFTEGKANCNDMDMRLIEFAHSSYHDKRVALNYFQPQIVEAVTKEGFMHIKLPEATYTWLRAWYQQAKAEQMQDESSSGSCMNQAVAPSAVTHITPVEKKKLAAELQVNPATSFFDLDNFLN